MMDELIELAKLMEKLANRMKGLERRVDQLERAPWWVRASWPRPYWEWPVYEVRKSAKGTGERNRA